MGVLSRFMSCPKRDHLIAAKSVLRHLPGPTHFGGLYGGKEALKRSVNASCRSKTGVVSTLNGGPISWKSKRQSTVARSTAEAENVASATASKEALWLWKMLSALGVDGGDVLMGKDISSFMALVNNPEATGRTKNFNVAYDMVRHY